MREMKDSGIEWIGEIPKNWKFARIGSLYGLRVEKVSDQDYQPLSVTKLGILPQLETAAKTNAHDDRKLVKIGDFAINSRSDRRGSCGISKYEGSVSLINTVLYPIVKMNPQYYNWFFHTAEFAEEFYRWGHGIVDDLWTTGWQDMKNVVILQPSLSEQSLIATFLDAKCTEIDALIADIQKQIETLEQYKRSVITEAVTKGLNPNAEMKDSKINWIGRMPAHWEIIRGKYILKYLQKPVQKDDGVITCFRDGEVTLRCNRREDGFTMSDKEIGYQGVDVGDLVVHGMDGFAGAIGISDSRGKASPVLNVLDTKQDKRYIMYYLRSMAYSDVFLALATGIRVRSCDLRWNKLAELSYPVPPITEQKAIVEYIDGIIAKTDSVIAGKKGQLETLDIYKKSLIFEYVTGKKEVPNRKPYIETVTVDPHVILAGMIIDWLGAELKGKTQIQKILYLFDAYLGLTSNTQYYRYNHGPYDLHLDQYLNTLTENEWFKKNAGHAEKYESGRCHDEFLARYKDAFMPYREEMNKLLIFAKSLNRTSQIERIATIFAAWNDFLLEGKKNPKEDEIIREIQINWTPNKANISVDAWKSSLYKMKKQGIIPQGRGLHTLPMFQRGVDHE